jgi:hypothetical protein
MMVRAKRSHVVASFGAAATIWPSNAMPARKSFLAKAESASLRICGNGLVGVPASDLICASSVTALSASSRFWNGFSAAPAAWDASSGATASSAAATPARTSDQIIGRLLPNGRAISPSRA